MDVLNSLIYRKWSATLTPQAPSIWLCCVMLIIAITCFAEASLAQTNNEHIEKVENYLNSIKSLRAKFKQLGPQQGERKAGELFLVKPGKIKWEYLSPKKISIIGIDGQITYHDYEMDETSHVHDKNAIFKLLTQNKINLKADSDFKFISSSLQPNNKLSITLSHKENGQDDATPNAIAIYFILTPSMVIDKAVLMESSTSSTTEIIFSDVKHNVAIPDATFVFKKDSFFQLHSDD